MILPEFIIVHNQAVEFSADGVFTLHGGTVAAEQQVALRLFNGAEEHVLGAADYMDVAIHHCNSAVLADYGFSNTAILGIYSAGDTVYLPAVKAF